MLTSNLICHYPESSISRYRQRLPSAFSDGKAKYKGRPHFHYCSSVLDQRLFQDFSLAPTSKQRLPARQYERLVVGLPDVGSTDASPAYSSCSLEYLRAPSSAAPPKPLSSLQASQIFRPRHALPPACLLIYAATQHLASFPAPHFGPWTAYGFRSAGQGQFR